MKKVFALGVGLALASGAFAQTWTEVGDADELAPQVTSGTGPLTLIAGSTLSASGDTTGVDLYCIQVTDWSVFSASLAGGATFDTQLFLFTASGMGIANNDDSSGVQSVLPAGNALYASRTNGEIVNIAVSGYNRDPNSVGGLIFPNTFSGVNGPTGPGGGSPLSSWSGTPATGDYRLALTGATYCIPEPGSLALLALGALPLIRRR
ncbi:MAG: DVUA0089 family protein [Phycisphaerales bacterium]|nr:DVUA0089 family protein [Phycisphaerales bacterium]